jgi:type II secretory ATPase GspE/PulE/Tfp pilus assembly ATPase PilB-like protein
LTFAADVARVRQDPYVTDRGIRDLETAEIAIRAALTGHLVFSTLHTNDAPSAITRLVDMGAEDYLIASSLLGVLAQRLVRVICPDCKTEVHPVPEMLDEIGFGGDPRSGPTASMKAAKTQHGICLASRIYELMIINDDIRKPTVAKPIRPDPEESDRKRNAVTGDDGWSRFARDHERAKFCA